MRTFKVIIAAALLLCLLPLPYGYYELVRLGGMVCFGVLVDKAEHAHPLHNGDYPPNLG